MDKIEILGFLLQNIRDDHYADEEDIKPSILRETTKIYDLIIHHGYLSRGMFDLTDIDDAAHAGPEHFRYAQYRTTNYPVNFVAFADWFAEWLCAEDDGARLEIVDLIVKLKEFSSLRIKLAVESSGIRIVVKSHKGASDRIHEEAFVAS